MLRILLAIIISTNLYAALPENELHKGDNTKATWNISEPEFWELIDYVYKIYKPIFNGVKSIKGEPVYWWFESDWNSPINNMYAEMKKVPPWNWNAWVIKVHGGLARRVQLTKDGFLLAMCHDIGHFLAGYPHMNYLEYSIEGQADYYATHVCARKIFGAMEKKNKLVRNNLKVELCDKNFDTVYEQNVCYRSYFAAKSLAETIWTLNGETRVPDPDIKDNYETKLTLELHTPTQCRLDTYIAGILCDKAWDDTIIPTNHNAVCRNRPRCFYAP
jgi:hypothetical protein